MKKKAGQTYWFFCFSLSFFVLFLEKEGEAIYYAKT